MVVMYVQSAKIVSSNPAHGKVYSIQHYVIKKIKKLSDLRKVSSFLRVSPPI